MLANSFKTGLGPSDVISSIGFCKYDYKKHNIQKFKNYGIISHYLIIKNDRFDNLFKHAVESKLFRKANKNGYKM